MQCLDIEDRSIESMAQHCTNLTYLNLSRCNGISDVTLHALALHCPALQVLHVSWTTVTTEAVVLLLQKCCCLTRLSLQGCKSVLHDVAEHIINAEHLVWVDLSWVNDISPELVADIVALKPGFCAIDYYGEEVRSGVLR
jgi:F-box/leucine-rich repeat protein 2/20